MSRLLSFERVVEKLKYNHSSYTKLTDADYSNLGVELFDDTKFADNLGVTSGFLQEIGLLKKQNQAGWNILKCPTADELSSFKEKIFVERSKNLKPYVIRNKLRVILCGGRRKEYMERKLGCVWECPYCNHKFTFGVGVY